MSLHFTKIKVKNIRRETDDCVSVSFIIPPELQPAFQYTQGQYITLRAFINNEEVRRSYSLCSSPLENEWRIAVKKTGLFSTFVNDELKEGDTLELMPPLGKFFSPLHTENKKHYVAIAAGSGITPVLSILKTTLVTEPQSRFTLVYGNRNRPSIIFKEALEALKNKYMERFQLLFVLSREITDATVNYGRINTGKCDQLFTKFINIYADEFFICGPEEMMFCVRDYLISKSVDINKIHVELFTTPEQKQHIHIEHNKQKTNEQKSKISIKLDGIYFDFDLDYDGENILNAALHKGADVPYSCKGGICSTCKAKLLEGEVEMESSFALDHSEIEQGYILTCQSHPKTRKVVIDFDVK